MSPFSCSACRGGLLRISFFSRVFTLFLSVFSRLDDERGTAEGRKVEVDEEEDREEEEEWLSAERSAMGLESRWEGMVVRMKRGRAGWRRRWDRTDWGIICHGGRVKIYVGWMEERMEERMEGCKRPVWTFEEKSDEDWSRDSFVRWLCEVMKSEWTKKRHRVVVTYVIFSSHPRLHCGPASPRCPPSSKNTEERCLMDFHGPGR